CANPAVRRPGEDDTWNHRQRGRLCRTTNRSTRAQQRLPGWCVPNAFARIQPDSVKAPWCGCVVVRCRKVRLLLVNGRAPDAAYRRTASEAILPDDFSFLFRIERISRAGFLRNDDNVAAIRQRRQDR